MDARDAPRSVEEDATLRRIVDTIAEALDPEQVILFGSRARGDEAAQSDYDICVVMELEPDGRRRELVQQIHGLFGLRGFSMDAFVLVQRQPSFYGLNTRSQNSQITARHFERSRDTSEATDAVNLPEVGCRYLWRLLDFARSDLPWNFEIASEPKE